MLDQLDLGRAEESLALDQVDQLREPTRVRGVARLADGDPKDRQRGSADLFERPFGLLADPGVGRTEPIDVMMRTPESSFHRDFSPTHHGRIRSLNSNGISQFTHSGRKTLSWVGGEPVEPGGYTA
jgi:hypothetical protein